MLQLILLGIIALGGGLLLIHLAIKGRPRTEAPAAKPESKDEDKGKVIYLFGSPKDDEDSEPEVDAENSGNSENAEENSEDDPEGQD